MNAIEKNRRIEFGDFQTPDGLAMEVCSRLESLGVNPDYVIEPTCGIGAFVVAAAQTFKSAKKIFGFEVNGAYLDTLNHRKALLPSPDNIHLEQADFFCTDWQERLRKFEGSLLVLGNFPWVTNSAQGLIGGVNLPEKNNFQKHNGFDAISGKSNFDISEWMLLEILRCLDGRSADIAMLVKTSVARKVLTHAQREGLPLNDAFIIGIDAKKHFGAAVEACLLVIRLSDNPLCSKAGDYTVYNNLRDADGHRVGHRMGLMVNDIDGFERSSFLVGQSPQKWRSGIKHDAAAVMEFTQTERGLENGLGLVVDIEDDFLYPLLKGSDVGSDKEWRRKYVLVTQKYVGEPTSLIQERAPKTWRYLHQHSDALDRRGSTIYAKNPRFSIFGVGDYAFRPWRIAICGLYKTLRFRLVAPMLGRPVMFDDTVYYLSFDSENEATETLKKLNSNSSIELLSSLIFWDEKRPIKTGVLNVLDWSRISWPPCHV